MKSNWLVTVRPSSAKGLSLRSTGVGPCSGVIWDAERACAGAEAKSMMNSNAMPDVSGERSRQLLEEHLRRDQLHAQTHRSTWNLFLELQGASRSSGFIFNWEAAVIHWTNLIRAGALAIIGDSDHHGVTPSRPPYVVTDHGRKMLERGAASPHDDTLHLGVTQASRGAGRDRAVVPPRVDRCLAGWAVPRKRRDVRLHLRGSC